MINLRTAKQSDAAGLAPLFEQLGYRTPEDAIATRLNALGARATVIVAEEGPNVLGFVAVSVRPDFIEERAVVEGLVVDQNARNRSVGAQLLRAAEAWAATAGASAMLVRSNVIRDEAHRFYEREGYHRRKSQHIFEKLLMSDRR